ncbi:MAG: exodeoxyribonuclease VII large subunit [Clostridia bacterium]|nr:exodeoxyribonuclease VII large subunit [Clostridia bacterium]
MTGQAYAAGALSVSELNEYARKLLAGDPLLRGLEVSGEISGYKHHYSGHRYFSLKDENARVQCVMFRQHAMGLDFQPADGMRVTVRASASIYPQNGSFQLYVTAMRQAGQGDLYIRFEKLKQKLMAEGLFDPARKREIPPFPKVIGVVTSETGAAIRDIIHVARRRNPNVGIVVSPCLVQGADAAKDIVRAMDRLNRGKACDVMLVGRGGGSIEDLWAFNEEIVARAIAASPIPVVSCVGHEVDFTISDFVADLRAPTPSAAAELTVPRLDQMKADLEGMVSRLAGALAAGQRTRRMALERLGSATVLAMPGRTLIEPRRARLEGVERRLTTAMPVRLERCRHRLDALAASLRALDPASVMDRGYAVVRQGERIVPRAALADGTLPLRVCFADGELKANITAVTTEDENR